MPNVELVKKTDISPFRKIAIGTWQTAYDPSIYGSMRIRMDRALKYIEDFRAATGKRITVTHLVTKALAEALRRCPDANGIIRWNRIYLRKTIDISVLVVLKDEDGGTGKVDLSAVKIEDADRLSLLEMAERFEKHVEKVRARKDPALEKTRQSMGMIPFLVINAFLKLLSFLLYTLNLDLRWAGLPKDPFGSAIVTNIGSLGLDLGYVPLVPYGRCPILACPGVIRDEPVVEGGKIVPGKLMDISATFDHRLIDGAHAASLAKTLREFFDDPERCFGALPAKVAAT
ncbi:MAG TPA: 2-oxo acid dehydrogenase subunit E2 [Planctomycetota bacterium]|nr:2-oxo acid dehydrogenase subunit E2 [Planctomycetota bacterium]